jgi:cell division septation protein DedD
VAIDVKTLDDPQWVPNVAGVRIVPRPGKAALIDFPVIATAEIEGLVTTTRRGRNEAAGGVVVELVDAAGKVVQQTKSAYDGVYVLPQVRPGRYEVRVAGSARHAVEVRNGQSLIAGINFGGAAMPGAAPPAPPVAVARAVPDAAKGAGAPPKPVVEAATPAPVAQGKFVVQLGAFSIERNALALLRRVPAARISHRGALYFVEAGPFRSRDEAAATRETLRGRGIEGIVRGGP